MYGMCYLAHLCDDNHVQWHKIQWFRFLRVSSIAYRYTGEITQNSGFQWNSWFFIVVDGRSSRPLGRRITLFIVNSHYYSHRDTPNNTWCTFGWCFTIGVGGGHSRPFLDGNLGHSRPRSKHLNATNHQNQLTTSEYRDEAWYIRAVDSPWNSQMPIPAIFWWIMEHLCGENHLFRHFCQNSKNDRKLMKIRTNLTNKI